jgi:putative DNA primase/helicase
MMTLYDRAHGQWRNILVTLGIEPKYLTGKHGPCPFCGGRDRWRFTDFNGDGLFICNQCGNGNGITLAMRYLKLPFCEVAKRIEAVIASPPPPVKRKRDKRGFNRMWDGAASIRAGDPVDRYLRARGFQPPYPDALRTASSLVHVDDGAFTQWPAMLGLVTSSNGNATTLHRTYLTKDGRKAPVTAPRKLLNSPQPGSAVRLAPPAPTLGIAEGIETALAARALFGIPTWSAISASGLKTFEPPREVETLIICADHDVNGTGQRAAYELASRLSGRLEIDIRIPNRPGDWNDVLRDCHAIESA